MKAVELKLNITRKVTALSLLIVCAQTLFAKQPVKFSYSSPVAVESVALAGTFNGWSHDQNMQTSDKKHWEMVKDLEPGVYEYKFVINGKKWITDPTAKNRREDAEGNINSVLWIEPNAAPSKISYIGIAHKPNFNYINLRQDGSITLRYRARMGDVQRSFVLLDGIDLKPKFNKVGDDGLFEYFSAQISNSLNPVRYVIIVNSPSAYLISAAGMREASKPTSTDWFTIDKAKLKSEEAPNWVQNAIIYQIFPDRFANGDPTNDPPGTEKWDNHPNMDNNFGGDLAGVTQHLDYLQKLGITVLKFNPIMQSHSNHKYDIDDYRKIDPNFGTNQQFAGFVKEAHKRGMKIVLDGVFNHSSAHFFAFDDILKNQERSKYLDWYHITGFPVKFEHNPKYWTWGGTEYMPKFNHDNPEVNKYLLDTVEYWQKMGIDGWRLDAAEEVSHDFWKQFRTRVKRINPNAYIVGEIWGDGTPWLQGDEFDAVMNYPFKNAVVDFTNGNNLPSQLDRRLLEQRLSYPESSQYAMFNLLGSHDTPRIINELKNNAQKLMLAKTLQFSYIGAPVIYYGDEIGIPGANQLDARNSMYWDWSTDEQKQFDFTKQLIEIRKRSEALRLGDFKTVQTDDKNGIYAFKRISANEIAMILLNNQNKLNPARLPSELCGLQEGQSITDILHHKSYNVLNGTLNIPLDPYGSAIFIYPNPLRGKL